MLYFISQRLQRAMIVIAVLFLMLLAILVRADDKKPEIREQIALIFDHKDFLGHLTVTAKAVPVLELQFMEDTQDSGVHEIAPMEKNSWMICRPFSQDNQLWFQCGSKRFVMKGLNFVPDK